MQKRIKYTIATACVIVVAIVTTAIAMLYPNARIVFSGIEMKTNGSSVQAFVDITLKNINATSISYCMQYDTEMVQLSTVDTNEPISNAQTLALTSQTVYNTEGKFFERNKTNFPGDGCFLNMPILPGGEIIPNMPIIGIVDADKGYVIMTFKPDANKEDSDFIEKTDEKRADLAAIMADGKEVNIGKISFLIKKPEEFSKLSENQLKQVFKIVPFSKMTSNQETGGLATVAPAFQDTGLEMSYTNEKKDIGWYRDANIYVEYDFDVTAQIESIEVQPSVLTVSSFDIYKNNSVGDAIDYLNANASNIHLVCADNSRIPASFTWDENKIELRDLSSDSITAWDPTGGEYKIVQKYKDGEPLDVVATLKVTPVKVTDFLVDNEDITYLVGSSDFPKTLDDLTFPKKAKAVLSPYVQNCGIGDLDVNITLKGGNETVTDIPDEFKGTISSPVTVEYVGHITNALEMEYPWLTNDVSGDGVPILRHAVLDADDMPNALEATAVTSDSGVLTITITNKGNPAAEIPSGTTFKLRLQTGEVLDTAQLGTAYDLDIAADGSQAVITIDPSLESGDYVTHVAQLINLGSRAGTYQIASKEPGKNQGPYASFTANPRKNVYLEAEGGGSYEFDYSGSLSALLPVKEGAKLPTTLTLPYDKHYVNTTYSGENGAETGLLRTVTISETEWEVLSGSTTEVGSVVTLKGTLADTNYTNYGKVENITSPPLTVTIKYVVSKDNGDDQIAKIDDFTFDTQTVGYGSEDIQTQTFSISNTGATDLNAVTATISISSVEGSSETKESFVMTQIPVSMIKKGETKTFKISTAMGMPVGKYTSVVTLSSSNGVLQTFNVNFEVIAEQVYKIKLTVKDEEFGTVKTSTEKYTSQANETITIIAESVAKDDYKFLGWTVKNEESLTDPEKLVLTDATKETTTFVMPERNVELEAVYEETIGAKLRLQDLYVKTDSEAGEVKYPFYNEKWESLTFDPIKRTYYTTIPNNKDKVKLKFKLRDCDEAKAATTTVTYTNSTKTDEPVTVNSIADDYFETDEFEIEVAPTDNTAVIKMSYDDGGTLVEREYTIHIFRKIDSSKLADFEYGNSPYGLIMNDTSIATEADKQAAMQQFIDDGYMFKNAPAGGFANIEYTEKMWDGTGVNYDLDASAVFVLNNSSFVDPGYTEIRDSLGNVIDTKDVKKSVEVEIMTETDTSKHGLIEDFQKFEKETKDLPNDGTIDSLKDLRIRPNVYKIKYSYKDFDGSTASVSKPLIILYPIGDYDIDKSAQNSDKELVLHRFTNRLANHQTMNGYNLGGRLYKYRICDTNKDGHVNAIDANHIRAGDLNEFYSNTGGGT